ncbi:MAG: dethiobiotin synthase [Campylobacterota bacterium]|nr:dethiobiotin synthase [Campylobacterota bacterium]
MIKIFVTATNTDIGKTYVTKLLLKELSRRGFRIAAFKPIETGVTNAPLDGTELLTLSQSLNQELENLHVDDIVPIQFSLPAAPYIANDAKDIDLNTIDNAVKKFEKLCDILIIEGAGGLLVPIDSKLMMVDLIKHFNAKTLLVSHCNLGCINDTLLSLNLLQQYNIPHTFTLNCRENNDSFKTVSKPYFDTKFSDLFIFNTDIKDLVDKLLVI